MRVGDPVERARRHRFARRALGDQRQRLRVGERVDRRQAVGLGDAFERLERDVAQHRDRLLAHGLVGVAPRNAASAAGSISLATAARRTRTSVSSRAISASSSRSSSGISWTNASRTAGSGCF